MRLRKFLVLAGALGAAASGIGFSAEAAEVQRSTSTYDYISACATWSNPNPEPGTSEWISVCGTQGSSETNSTSINESSLIHQQSYGHIGTRSIRAQRQVCDQVSGGCSTQSYDDFDVSDGEVAIDMETGTARFLANVQGCEIDVTIDAPEESEDGTTLPQWNGFNYYPAASLHTALRSYQTYYRYGTASGLACGWSDLMSTDGYGSLSEGTSTDDAFSVYGGV